MQNNPNARDRGEESGREWTKRSNRDDAAPMPDREVPLDSGSHTPLLVQQWLDGEASEDAARSVDGRQVDLWNRINSETDRRRRTKTPPYVMAQIMEALPVEAPAVSMEYSWWHRPLAVKPAVAFAAGAGLLAIGAILGAVARR
jgi:hypothetical protein